MAELEGTKTGDGPELPLDVAERARGFIGRGWVLERIDAWLADPKGPRTFLLVGGPGAGKSAIAARLVQMARTEAPALDYPHLGPGFITYAHFCRALQDSSLDPLRFVETLSERLVRYPAFAQAILQSTGQDMSISATQTVGSVASGAQVRNVVIESLQVGNLSGRTAFDRLIRRPLEALFAGGFDQPLLILVDALDEALTYSAEENLVAILGSAIDDPAELPAPVRFLLTSRPHPMVKAMFGAPSLDLLVDLPDGVDEVRDYAYLRLESTPEPRRAALAARVGDAGAGNFLYARHVVGDLLAHHERALDPEALALPEGLNGQYRAFLDRDFGRKRELWEQSLRAILAALAVARGEGLTVGQIAGMTGLGKSRTDDALRACTQYLSGPDGEARFRVYHQSFRDFLLSDPDYRVYPDEANRGAAQYFLEQHGEDWAACRDDYALAYTPAHLIESIRGTDLRPERRQLVNDLTGLLTNLAFLETKTARSGLDSVLEDFRLASDLIPPDQDSFRLAFRVLDREAHNLRRWNPKQFPAFFLQQVRNRALIENASSLVRAAGKRLNTMLEPYFELQWRIGPETPSLKRTLRGHQDAIWAVALTPDRKRALSASSDGTLRLWDLTTGRHLRTFTGHDGSVRAVAITPDGRLAVSGSKDLSLKVWDLETGHVVHTLRGHRQEVRAVALIGDGRRAISASWDRTIRVWDLETGEGVRTLEGHRGQILGLAVTADGRRAVSASWDRTIRVWDLETGEEIRTLTRHDSPALSVGLTPDGSLALVGHANGTMRMWDLKTGVELRTFPGHTDGVSAVAVFTDGKSAVSGSEDSTVRVWDLETGDQLHILSGHEFFVEAVAVTPDGKEVISGSWDRSLKVWDLDASTRHGDQMGHSGAVRAVAVTADGRHAVSGSWDRSVKVWEAATGRLVTTLTGHEGRVWAVALAPPGHLLSGSDDGTLRLWNLATGDSRIVGRSETSFLAVAVTPDGHLGVAGSLHGAVSAWDLLTGNQVGAFGEHSHSVWDVAATPDSGLAVSASEDRTLKIWDLRTGEAARTIVGHDKGVRAVAITQDGRKVASGSDDRTIRLWNLERGQELKCLTGHEDWIWAVAVTSDGHRLLSGSGDRSVRAWTLQTGLTSAMAYLDGAIRCLAVAPDDITVLVGDMQGSVTCLRYVERSHSGWYGDREPLSAGVV